MIKRVIKTITAQEFNAHFYEVLEEVKSGEKIEVTNGTQNDIIGFFMPMAEKKPVERTLGILNGKAKAIFGQDFTITEEEFLGI